MKNSTKIARQLIVLALATIFLASAMVLYAYAVGRPPTPSPTPLPGTNGRIAYVVEPNQSFPEIYSMNPDGSDPVRLTNNTVGDDMPVYSPDGAHIVYVSQRNNNQDIYLMNADGSNDVRLTTDAADDNSPAWSADGTKIAFVSTRAGNEQIFTMNPDGSNQVQLTSFGINKYPAWSPDATKFAFVSFRLGVDSYEVFTMNADGSNPVAITHNIVADVEPVWSPTGDKIAFTRAVGDPNAPNYEIFVINPDGSNEIRLTDNNPRLDVHPTWSPDASKIAFSSNRDNVFGNDVFVMNADGSNLTNITLGNGARGSQPSWGTAPVSTPTPTPDSCNAQNSITMLPTQCGSGLVHTPLAGNHLFEKPVADRGIYSFDAMMSAEAMMGDGTVEFTLSQGGTAYVGLTQTEAFCDYDSVDYLFHVDANYNGSPGGSGIYFIREYDSPGGRADAGFFNPSNIPVFRIERHGDTVTYFVNNNPYWTSNKHSNVPLHLYVILYAPNTQVLVTQFTAAGGLKVRGLTPQVQNVTWQNPINVTINGNAITKTGGGSESYDAGASSVQQITRDNSFYRFKPATADDNFLAALAIDDQNASFPVAPISLYFSHGSLYDWVNGLGAYLGSFDADSEYELAVNNGVVNYYRIDPATGAHTRISGHGSKVKFPYLFDTSLRTTGSGVRDVTFGEYPYVSPCEAVPTPTPTPPPATDMRVFASIDQTFVPSGGQVTFSFTASNNGGYPAANVTISSQLPQGVTFNSVVSDGGGACTGTPGGSSFSCSFANVNPSESQTVSISFIATGTPYAVIAVPYAVASSTLESFPDDNSGVGQFYIASPPLPTPTPANGASAELAYFATAANGNGDLYRRRADGAGLLNLTNNSAIYYEFVWSPDGNKIAFTRFEQANSSINLFVMDADGTNQTRLTNIGTEQDLGVAWSPDGTRLAFSACDLTTNAGGSIHSVNVDGSDLRILTPTTGNDRLVAWSPDGTRLSFTRSVFDFQSGSFAQSIYVMNPDGSNQIKFANPAGEIDYDPAWSPDGLQIAFLRSPNDGLHGPNLFLAQRDGTNMRNLTNDYSLSFDRPQWSPDGSKLSFLSSPDNSNYHLSVINADGSGRTTLSGSVNNISSNKGWSPNGAKLVFIVSYGEVNNGLYIVNANGTGLAHIGDDIERNDNPAWSPDSSKLAFTSARNSQGSIDIVNADGTNRVDLTNAPASYGPPKWRPVPSLNTPAGANVTITVNGVQLTFSNVTQAGQTTVTPIDPNSLSGVPGEYVINANSLAFEIHTTAVFTGPITIGFQVPGVNNPITFSALRVLHGEPPPVPNFVDRTVLAPDTPAPNFATRTIYARVTSLSPFVIATAPANQLTALGPAQVWIGLKNSDDVGTKFDLLAEVFKNGTLIGSGQLNDVAGGSSGFNNARLDAISLALSGTPSFGAGNTLSIRLSVRIAASSGHRSGTARLWFNDSAANSRFSATIGGVTNNYYLRKPNDSLVLTTTTGSTAKITIDVLVDRAVGGNPFKPFGTWSITF